MRCNLLTYSLTQHYQPIYIVLISLFKFFLNPLEFIWSVVATAQFGSLIIPNSHFSNIPLVNRYIVGGNGLVIVMVGLPARGKTYIAKKLTRNNLFFNCHDN